jgi:uncharacterized membrane protein
MDLKLLLVAFVLPGLAVVFGIPMVLGVVPPNRFYGYRTRKTLSSEAVWYRANRVAGWSLLLCGIAALGHNLLLQHNHPDWPSATKQFVMTVSAALLMLAGLIFSSLYVRKLR